MSTTTSEENTLKNERHYDEFYSKVGINSLLRKVDDLDQFLGDAIKTDNSWVGLYYDSFEKELKNKKVLELGCGNCLNAAVMAKLGAEVYANDISQVSGTIIDRINKKRSFDHPLKFVHGDFLKSDLPENYFDYVVGKDFVHHLTHDQEEQFTEIIVRILKEDGKVRYMEPAVNSKFFDELRWMIPVGSRPSKLQKSKFKEWKKNDPHPDRDNSSGSYKKIGERFFKHTRIVPIGSIARLHRMLPNGESNRKFRRFAFKLERYVPRFLNMLFARSQMVEYAQPKK